MPPSKASVKRAMKSILEDEGRTSPDKAIGVFTLFNKVTQSMFPGADEHTKEAIAGLILELLAEPGTPFQRTDLGRIYL